MTTLVRKEDVQRKWYVLDAADNTLGRTAITRLKVYSGAEHPHAAQKPEAFPQD